jgi:hypothetical protein
MAASRPFNMNGGISMHFLGRGGETEVRGAKENMGFILIACRLSRNHPAGRRKCLGTCRQIFLRA